jgi:glucose-6-phosphate 1-dehydrogenase
MITPEEQVLVIFGASGDLTKRKLIPALFDLELQGLLPDKFAILGISRTAYSDESFRDKMEQSLKQFNPNFEKNETLGKKFLEKLYYLAINTSNVDDYAKVKDTLNNLCEKNNIQKNYIYYLSTPPSLYEVIPHNLCEHGLTKAENGENWYRLIVEKPFGIDLKSAKALNKNLLKYFHEEQIYRIDHYLGKETVQNVLVTRFSNGIFEPLWNRNYIHHVEVTSVENIGVENRGGYYDQSGAMRDMVQNHLMQLVGLIAMEPPTNVDSKSIRNETLKVFQSLRPLSHDDIMNNIIRGQYINSTIRGEKINGYRDEEGVPKNSRTETFMAMKFYIDNWRWGGVPFYIRTGKRLPTRVTEIVINFKSTPHQLFLGMQEEEDHHNQLIIRIQPDEGILLKFGMKVPGAGFTAQKVNMDFHYSDLANTYLPSSYERLLLDCMLGDSTLYARADAVEASWKFVDPILEAWEKNSTIPLHGYPAGTWGPQMTDNLMDDDHHWRQPCKNLSNDGEYCEL